MKRVLEDNLNFFKPLVIGAPRSGFSLLINILMQLYPLTTGDETVKRRVLKAFSLVAGQTISNRVEQVITSSNLKEDLIYNNNFRLIVGGPYWLDKTDNKRVCFRKYIGVRGKGDFTLITSHPRSITNFYEVLHSHSHPEDWLKCSDYSEYIKFASIRHPADILASSCFSINALASEYIQRFVPPDQDNDSLRQKLAMYKLSNLEFFEGLIRPLKSYLEEFLEHQHQFDAVMKWEDLIEDPVKTIVTVAKAFAISIDDEYAGEIWEKLAYKNLTGAHKHNFRKGHGRANSWLYSLTSSHIECMQDNGLEPFCEALGYGKFPELSSKNYNSFQKTLDSYIGAGKIHDSFEDMDLFGYAFNKSNLDAAKFSNFKVYDWREHTRIERSSFTDETLLMQIWDAAEESVAEFNAAYEKLDRIKYDTRMVIFPDIRAILKVHGFCNNDLNHIIEEELKRYAIFQDPVLIRSVNKKNIVSFAGLFYCLPQALGPIDFHKQNVKILPGVIVADKLSELINFT